MCLTSQIIGLATVPVSALAVWWAWRARQLSQQLRPRFPTINDLCKEPVETCVCGGAITTWEYPGQTDGTAGGCRWWVHIHNARRSHSRDIRSGTFHSEPFAKPQED
jgi:hypothetical protein